jgi:hypothetical protein
MKNNLIYVAFFFQFLGVILIYVNDSPELGLSDYHKVDCTIVNNTINNENYTIDLELLYRYQNDHYIDDSSQIISEVDWEKVQNKYSIGTVHECGVNEQQIFIYEVNDSGTKKFNKETYIVGMSSLLLSIILTGIWIYYNLDITERRRNRYLDIGSIDL